MCKFDNVVPRKMKINVSVMTPNFFIVPKRNKKNS